MNKAASPTKERRMFGFLKRKRGEKTQGTSIGVFDADASNKIYREVVNERVLQLRHEVMDEFRKLGFRIYTSSGFLHEATITMAGEVNATLDDEEAKKRLRPIIRRWVIHDDS